MTPAGYLAVIVVAALVLGGLAYLQTWLGDRAQARREDGLVARVTARVREDLARSPCTTPTEETPDAR